MRNIIDKTSECYLALDIWFYLVPAANLNRPIKSVSTSRKG